MEHILYVWGLPLQYELMVLFVRAQNSLLANAFGKCLLWAHFSIGNSTVMLVL